MNKLLTVKELAEFIGVAEGTIYHWVSARRVAVVRLSKRCIRFSESDVRELVEKLKSPARDV